MNNINEYLYLLFSKRIYDFYIEGKKLTVLASRHTSREGYGLVVDILRSIRNSELEIKKIIFEVDAMIKLKINELEIIPRFEIDEEEMYPYVIRKLRFLNTRTDKIRWCWSVYNLKNSLPEVAYMKRGGKCYQIYAMYQDSMIKGYRSKHPLDESYFIQMAIDKNIYQLEDYLQISSTVVENIRKSVELFQEITQEVNLNQFGGIDV